MPTQQMLPAQKLQPILGPWMLWGLGVGYVISGMYFGWNLGLAEGGTLGLGIATGIVILMYITFTLSYTELACAIPKAGGAFCYADKAFGPKIGFLAGMAQNVEFIFAPPAIAYAIGAYLSNFLPFPIELIAISAYLIFTFINILGIRMAALFELIITIFAVIELIIFAGCTLPHFDATQFTSNPLPHGWSGIFYAIPFAIWFFLAIEGIANVAEETVNPQKNVMLGFSSAMGTLIFLCILTFISAVGVNGWEAIVYESAGAQPSDSPLPLALKLLYGENAFVYHLLIGIGLLGLVASFHGIILAAGRATFEFGRMGYASPLLAKIHPTFKTPHIALLLNMVVGIIAILTGKTGTIITLAGLGAVTLYFISICAFFKLRRSKPFIHRPFVCPGYPVLPSIALILSSVCLIAMVVCHPSVTLIYLTMMIVCFSAFQRKVGRQTELFAQ